MRGFHTYEIRVNGTICSEGTQFCDWWGAVVCQCARYRNIITWELVPDATYQATRYSVGPDEWNLALPKSRSGSLAGVQIRRPLSEGASGKGTVTDWDDYVITIFGTDNLDGFASTLTPVRNLFRIVISVQKWRVGIPELR